MILPYTINVPDERLVAIRDKVAAYDWTRLPDLGGWKSGVGVRDLQRLVAYWLESYDWRRVEKHLNQLPNFITEIEGEHLHFVHVRGDGSRPPILLLHGWPGSYLEFEALLEPLAADGHDVIVPSLPGFAFSRPITGVIGPRRAGELMHGLMARLFGPTRFIVQGGDWGSGIAGWMAHDRPEALLGIHLNMADLLAQGTVATTPEEEAFVARRDVLIDWETGYNHQQETRPQTLGVALADSPVGAAGWILEKIGTWADLPTTADGSPDLWGTFTEEQLLTNIMLYLAPSSMVTATWMYHGKRLEGSSKFPVGTRIQVPTGFAAFRDPVFVPPPRSFAEKTFNIVHWSEMPAGGHFAAWEQPALMLADLRAFIATVSA
ncbi:epoxide hydrolase [Pseudomonas sp. D8002]|jgi:pimeloyl-ACP methyl ester carboxylesterase|uniref:epoxide hydrolase family protein n=1 Tax=Pseudomonas TaxID=286 RepID=UPI000281C5AC|nr:MULTISPECIES: epoxide hydrolase family protein [Pseudomonas]MDQ0668548.1 pimeloyl-ACP methyl ester carboxylesterase [Pseudomonas sp. W2I6]NVZ16292.1 epoxide hydrolase [Pseudomonas sp. IPO3775]NWA35736.1 epoxide hydrolase [Pseudomonas sp. C6002]NWA77089.1 epoxide hydrolase [Pseudomonas sp. C8002]NWA90460.1 epoxide hydrolase [Pseudomonas sp. D8002]